MMPRLPMSRDSSCWWTWTKVLNVLKMLVCRQAHHRQLTDAMLTAIGCWQTRCRARARLQHMHRMKGRLGAAGLGMCAHCRTALGGICVRSHLVGG